LLHRTLLDSRRPHHDDAQHADTVAMIDFSQNYFALFGLPPQYRFDAARLDAAYRALQTQVHPDRFAAAGESERRLALQSSARVNEAYRALKDPVGRAQYLLSLHGIDATSETDTALPIDFLERQLERREAVDEARIAGEIARLEALLAEVRAEIAALEPALAETLDSEQRWESARAGVRELQFLSKLAADIDAAIGGIDD
jgi:molecular chaperone HscB